MGDPWERSLPVTRRKDGQPCYSFPSLQVEAPLFQAGQCSQRMTLAWPRCSGRTTGETSTEPSVLLCPLLPCYGH